MGFFSSVGSAIASTSPEIESARKQQLLEEEIEKQRLSVEQDKKDFVEKQKEVEQAMKETMERMAESLQEQKKPDKSFSREERLDEMMKELKGE